MAGKPPSQTAATLRGPHGFFGRAGGVSIGIYGSLNGGPGSNDDLSSVMENRGRVAHTLGASDLVTTYQRHTAIARIVTAPWAPGDAPVADGLVSEVPGLAIGVLTADCVPLLFEGDGLVGGAHAGWRGSLGGIIEATLTLMVEMGAPVDSIRCAIGPALRAPLFEVGADLKDAVAKRFGSETARFFVQREGTPQKWTYDHIAFVQWRLMASGLNPDRIEDVGDDTLGAPDRYFSYRHSRQTGAADYGRNISAIALPKA